MAWSTTHKTTNWLSPKYTSYCH